MPGPPPAWNNPRPSTSPYTPTPTPSATPSGGGGGSFLPALGGSLLGSWIGSSLGSHNSGGTTVVNNGGASVAPAGMASTPMVMQAAQPQWSIWGVIWNVIGLMFLAGLIFLAYHAGRMAWKAYQEEKANKARLKARADAPPFTPTRFFLDVQQAFAARDLPTLGRLLTADLLAQMLQDLPEVASESKLKHIRYEYTDVSDAALTISYQANDYIDNTHIDERWHLELHHTHGWQLAGIEQNT